MIQPHRMADDLGRKPMPGIRGRIECHTVSLAYPALKHQPRLTWQCPVDRSRDCILKSKILLGSSARKMAQSQGCRHGIFSHCYAAIGLPSEGVWKAALR
jgi:hypothetical protein